MTKIYVYDVTDADHQQLKKLFDTKKYEVVFSKDPLSLNTVKKDAEVVSVFLTSTISDEIIRSMPHLRLIACRSTGFNNVDLNAAHERDITVVNVPTYGEHTVAEYAFGLLLMLTRKLREVVSATQQGVSGHEPYMGTDLAGKTLGVVGAGHIGQRMLQIGKGLDMTLLAYDPKPQAEIAHQIGFRYVELMELLQSSDVVSLHVPLMADNQHLIDKAQLAVMKPGAILVNTARGELVDTDALIDVLQSGKLGGAALDVIEGEKALSVHEELALLRAHLVPQDQLRKALDIDILQKLPNVVLTNHNAFNTVEAIERINVATADNISRYLRGKPQNIVRPPTVNHGKLVIVRHGESEWNALGVWTGSRDVHLSEKGFHDAALLGQALQDVRFDVAYASEQIRSLETLEGILDASQQFDVPIVRSKALNERDYGDYTGKNKWQVKKELGEEIFEHLRRDWDYPVPNGETLRMVYERAVPYYLDAIVPQLLAGKTVLVVSHGNAIRALMKYIESVRDDDIASVEMLLGDIITYDVDEQGRMTKKIHESIEDKAA